MLYKLNRTTGFLAYWDFADEELVYLGDFQGGAQITGSVFINDWLCPQHDVALKSIDYPETGPAGPDMKMQVTVKNKGFYTETFDAQMEIISNQSGPVLLEENFSGTFPPEGWEVESWTQCNDDCSPDPPCACLYPENQNQTYNAYMISKPVDASEYETCTLTYYFAANLYYQNYCSFYVKYRTNESSPWKDVTPWDNPLGQDIEGDLFEINCNGGDALQIKWEYFGYYYYYNCYVLDSIMLQGSNNYVEYAELVEDITLDAGEEMAVDFPAWTPSQWQDPEYEDTWVDYTVYASTILEGDQNPSNDNKYKIHKKIRINSASSSGKTAKRRDNCLERKQDNS